MKRSLLSLLFAPVTIFAFVSVCHPQYTVIQLSTGPYSEAPRINNNGQVVWWGFGPDFSDPEIFLHDGVNTVQFTNNEYEDVYPQISDNGHVVWLAWDGSDSEIFVHDGTGTIQLTDNDCNELAGFGGDLYPGMSDNGHVVWWECYLEVPLGILLYDGTSTIQIAQYDSLVESPQVNNSGQVVWVGGWKGLGEQEIFLYDGTGTIQLTDHYGNDEHPRINEAGHVVWHWKESWLGSRVVWLYDGSTSTKIADSGWNPQINNSDRVVWEGSDGDAEIFLYDGTGTTQLTNNDHDDADPQISDNGDVVWGGSDGSDGEIFLHDGTGIIQLTDNDYADYDPQINNNGYVVWNGDRGGEYGVFLAVPCSQDDDYDQDTYVSAACGGSDCDEGDPNVNPGAMENRAIGNCGDGKDNDCDGLVDEDPECGGSCAGPAAASALDSGRVHDSSEFGKHLAYLLLPIASVVAIWFRQRRS